MISHLYHWQYLGRQWLAAQRHRLAHGNVPATAATITQDPRRVLVVIAGLIGDSVMCTPVIMEARRLWPDAHITLLGQEHNCQLLSACPLIDEYRVAAALPFTTRNRKEIRRLRKWLQAGQFEVAIICLGDQFAPLLADAGIALRVGGRGSILEPCLTHTYETGSPRTWGPGERLGALRVLGCEVEEVAPRLWVSDAAQDQSYRRFRELGLPEEASYVLVHPFGSSRHQWWPVERVVHLAELLYYRYQWKTVIVGGTETRGQVRNHTSENVIDATGALTIGELLGAVEGAEMVITTDSGPFHIAGALGRPLVGLFRARRPEHASRYPGTRVIFGRHPRCGNHCFWNRCESTPCRQMTAIGVTEVIDAVRSVRRVALLKPRPLVAPNTGGNGFGQGLARPTVAAFWANGEVISKRPPGAATDREMSPGHACITDWDALLSLREQWRHERRIVVWTNGCFDLLHVGHVRSLQAARRLGDLLVVGLNGNRSVRRLKGPGKPIIPQQERAEVLVALDCVDHVVIFDELTPEVSLSRLKPDIHCKGEDYAPPNGKPIPETKVVESYGGRIVFLPLYSSSSTTGIVCRIRSQVSAGT